MNGCIVCGNLNKAIDSLKKDNARVKVILDAAVQYSNLRFPKYLDSTCG